MAITSPWLQHAKMQLRVSIILKNRSFSIQNGTQNTEVLKMSSPISYSLGYYSTDTRIHHGLETQYILRLQAQHGVGTLPGAENPVFLTIVLVY